MSQRFSLNSEDVKKWIRNTAIFLAPAVLVFLLEIQAGKPVSEAMVALKVWGLSTAIDLLRKFIANGSSNERNSSASR